MALTKVNSTLVDGAINTTSAGYVGIGTSSPNTPLSIVANHVGGQGILKIQPITSYASGGLASISLNDSDNTRKGFIYQDVNGMGFEAIGATPISFLTDAKARFTIGSDGAISAGSATSTVGLGIWSNYGSRIVDFARYADDGAIVGFKRGATVVGTISVTGSATAYNTSSDYRLKENIAPMTGALAKVSSLKPCTYTWKADGSNGQGFIAHELAEVVPQAVTGEKDALDKDGNPEYQGIDVSFLVATLTAAIQEQQAIITDLKARIETLEAK
jgi:hypothetical protein